MEDTQLKRSSNFKLCSTTSNLKRFELALSVDINLSLLVATKTALRQHYSNFTSGNILLSTSTSGMFEQADICCTVPGR